MASDAHRLRRAHRHHHRPRHSGGRTARAQPGHQHLYQGREDKLAVLDELLGGLGLGYESRYLGDDLPDLPVIRRVDLGMAVASADRSIAPACHGVTAARGGGAPPAVLRTDHARRGTLEAAQSAYL